MTTCHDTHMSSAHTGEVGIEIAPSLAAGSPDTVLAHPVFQNFGRLHAEHPPMRGWLATSVCGADGRVYGLLQLSDKRGGAEFDAEDESHVRDLAALVGQALDGFRLGTPTPQAR